MSDFKQNLVSSAVWPWTRPTPEARKAQRSFSERLAAKDTWKEIFIHAMVAIVVGWFLLYRHFDKPIMAKIVWTIGAIVVLSLLFAPPLHRKIQQFFQWFGAKLALVVTWIVLVPFFYLCFWPGRIILHLKGTDPMHRKFPTNEPTYWIPRPPVPSLDQYKKQH